MTNFFLVRHGETDWNLVGRIQGATDIPLNETGRTQARATGEKMRGRHWDVILSSPLSRAFETASIIAASLGMPAPIADHDLVERNYGDAEGMTGPELEAFYPHDTPIPGRESREAVKVRVLAAIHRIAAEHRGKNVVIVAHGGVIRAVLQSTTGQAYFGERIANGSVHSFHHSDDGLELVQFNDPLELLTDDITLPDFEEQQPLERRE
jgi:uncharacterized phosphatase